MPIDTADKFTTAAINLIEKELHSLYSATFRDIKKQLTDVVAKMELGGDLTPQQRYLNAQKYNRLTALQAQLSETLQNTNREAMRIINKSNVNVYAENYNYTLKRLQEYAPNLTFPTIDKAGVAKILRGEVTPFTHMALDNIKDRDIIERALTRELTIGIMQGEGIPKLANRIKEQTNKNLFQSIRIARTESNRIQNAGRQDAFDKGEDMGLHIVKRWVSTHDHRTRDSHAAANGQRVPNGKPFIVGGHELMFPSDQTAAPEESINCSCTVVAEVVTKEEYEKAVKEYEKLR